MGSVETGFWNLSSPISTQPAEQNVLRLDVDRIVWITILENLLSLWSVSYWLRMRAPLVLHIPMDDVGDTLDNFQGGHFVHSLLQQSFEAYTHSLPHR